jgi:alkyl hydroperoxide reductase subunit AhpF
LLVRGPSLSDRMSAYLINELERASNVSVWPNTAVIGVYGQGRLDAIAVRDTSTPGIFASGDVRHGSVKRVASAVGEGASAV